MNDTSLILLDSDHTSQTVNMSIKSFFFFLPFLILVKMEQHFLFWSFVNCFSQLQMLVKNLAGRHMITTEVTYCDLWCILVIVYHQPSSSRVCTRLIILSFMPSEEWPAQGSSCVFSLLIEPFNPTTHDPFWHYLHCIGYILHISFCQSLPKSFPIIINLITMYLTIGEWQFTVTHGLCYIHRMC